MPDTNSTALVAAVLDTEARAARFDVILGAIRDFAKGRLQSDVWEEIVRTALHDEGDDEPANDPKPLHVLADWVLAELELARAAGQVWEYGIAPAHTLDYAMPVYPTLERAQGWLDGAEPDEDVTGLRVARRTPAVPAGLWELVPPTPKEPKLTNDCDCADREAVYDGDGLVCGTCGKRIHEGDLPTPEAEEQS